MTLVLYQAISEHSGVITLNDPDNLNAMGEEMADEFSALITKLQREAKKLRALILTGSGRAFSAGGNLEMLEKKTSLNAEENHRRMLNFYNSFLCMLDLGVPLIAAINGHAIGAGLCVASACDVRVCSDKARLGFTFTKLGLHPGMGATYFLPKLLGYASAAELILTGRVIEAPEALRVGLVSKIVAAEKVVEEAKAIAQEICECGPESIKQVLQTLRQGVHELPRMLEREATCQSINYGSQEFKEGVRAAIEKRKPAF
ncbi:MAG: enoyl-CoA hydratase/isomerase family protein [Proteobacteria bacterium]|nr:MAG: enoyl-CoA hydratase/isomerase family protein [Pseudomonadota bacterium]